MIHFDALFDTLFLSVLNQSIVASYVIIGVLLVRLFLKPAPKIFSYALWSVVLFRLVCPFSFERAFSVIPAVREPIPQDIGMQKLPQITTGIMRVDTAVNASLPAPNPAVGASINPLQIWIFVGRTVWLLGIVVLLGYSLCNLYRLTKELQIALPLHREAAKTQAVATQWKEKVPCNVYYSERIETAFVFGVCKPKIYLPSQLSRAEMPYILCHEQTHIRRGDHIIKLIAFLTLCVHWFNPLVWFAFALCVKDMELSCDESVIQTLGNHVKKEYSLSLLSLATGKRILGGTPLAFGEGDTKSRIKNVLKYRKPAFLQLALALCVVVSAMLLLLGTQKTDTEPVKIGTANGGSVQSASENSENYMEQVGEPEPAGSASDSLANTPHTGGANASQDQTSEAVFPESPSVTQNSFVAIQFPAYDQRTEFNTAIFDITPFAVLMELPEGWHIATPPEEGMLYSAAGAWTPLAILDANDIVVGAIGYNVFDESVDYDAPMSIYNQVALANHYAFDAHSAVYQEIMHDETGAIATTTVYRSAIMNEGMGLAATESDNKGILAYNRARKVYIAIELEETAIEEDAYQRMAQSVQFTEIDALE